MALSKIWVFAEAIDGKVQADHPRAADQGPRAAGNVEVTAVYGGDGDAVAAELGAHGATKVLRHRRPRRHAARRRRSPSAIAGQIDGGRRPRPHPLRHHLRRPRRRRPPVGQARQAGAHQQHRRRASTATGRRHRADLRRHAVVQTKFTGAGPAPRARPAEVVRGRGAGGGAAAVEALAVPDTGAAGAAKVTRPPRRGDHRSEARRGRRRGLRRPWPRRGRQVRDGRAAGQAAQGRARRLPGHRRRRLGALLATRSARPARS